MNKKMPINLPGLPLELLLMISEHCRHCLSRVMQRPIVFFAWDLHVSHSLPKGRTGCPEDGRRIDFLTRFARDLPQYYLCHACLRLHIWQNVALPGPKFKVPACVESLDRKVHRLKLPLYVMHYPSHAYYKFHCVHLQLSMRRFYRGAQFGIPVPSLLYTEAGTNPITKKALKLTKPYDEEKFQCSHMTTLLSIDVRICSNPPSLYLRTQELAVVRRQYLSLLFPDPKNEFMHVCMHINRGFKLISVVHRLTNKYSYDPTTKPRDQGRCDKSNASWQIEIRSMGQKEVCLVFTRWLDLGPGLSPDDDRWRCHNDHEFEVNLAEHEKVDP